MVDIMETYQLVFYICLFLAPFLQEDVSVLGAATASAGGVGNTSTMFIVVSLGLLAGASLKYWLGRAANHQSWAKKYTENPKILSAKAGVQNNLGKSMFVARFVPMARAPLYLASGFFNAPFLKFSSFVLLAALLYVAITFGLFHVFGEIAGERMGIYLPIAAVFAVILYLVFSNSRNGVARNHNNQRVKVTWHSSMVSEGKND